MKFTTPKSEKDLSLVDFIIDIPTYAVDPPINGNHLDEHYFSISLEDTSYDNILVYLCIKKFGFHISCDD
jgi:hypothetical protein